MSSSSSFSFTSPPPPLHYQRTLLLSTSLVPPRTCGRPIFRMHLIVLMVSIDKHVQLCYLLSNLNVSPLTDLEQEAVSTSI